MFGSDFENSGLLEEQYEKYTRDKKKVDPAWQKFFETWQQENVNPEKEESFLLELIQNTRENGHLFAHVNPLSSPKELTLGDFSKSDLAKTFPTHGLLPEKEATLEKILRKLKSIYCSTIGYEYMGLQNKKLEEFIQKEIEQERAFPTKEEKIEILKLLIKAQGLETFIHTKFVGQKRFSLEGEETLIPVLATCIESGASFGGLEFVVGMAHRGRLNVLAHILNKPYEEILLEFDESYLPQSYEGSGDVKYHKGYFHEVTTSSGKKVKIDLSPNPSHLEAVNPVVEGMTKAKQVKLSQGRFNEVIPILIHGDAAIAGQGVVYETMQFYKLPGYATGGTLHIVINNHIGFTTLPEDSYSTRYCTDIDKTFGAPVFHVNAEDPLSCCFVAGLAMRIRQKFACDVCIDLNGYRKYGHNETDEPSFTQPLEYQQIRQKKTILEIYKESLIQEGVVEKSYVEELEKETKEAFQKAFEKNKNRSSDMFKEQVEKSEKVDTGCSKETLINAAEALAKVPANFTLHPKLLDLVNSRLQAVKEDKSLDWGTVETLAYATLLLERRPIRISGQDSCRGTFSHRHALWVDQKDEKTYLPLQHLSETQGLFTIYNSPLSEGAVLGFEFGYSESYKEALVIWEAQFGDFANGAQVIIDQFIVPSEQKWGLHSGVVLYLPHGYEGQGPEHSSARIERFLSLAGHQNICVVNPTTPAQLFHLLRRQVLGQVRRPLIVFTPKGLLRYPLCVSSLNDLTSGEFAEVLDDPKGGHSIKKLLFCSGRIYYDLLKANLENIAIIRIEQLYPTNLTLLKKIIDKYKGFEKCLWVQEEPANMGAWDFIKAPLQALLPMELHYVGRERSASTAVGSQALHKQEWETIKNKVLA